MLLVGEESLFAGNFSSMLGLSLLKGLVIAVIDRTLGFRPSATTQRLSTIQINLSPFTKDFCVLGLLIETNLFVEGCQR